MSRPSGFGSGTVALLLGLAVLAGACGSEGASNGATPGASGTPAATASPATSPSPGPTLFGTFTPTSTPTPSPQQIQAYRNDAYGYSFSVACPPFCQLSDTALDIFRAVSTDGSGAWFESRVYDLTSLGNDPTLEAFHDLWKREMAAVATDFEEVSAKDATLVDRTTPALLVEWAAAGAADGGDSTQARTLLAVRHPLGYSLSVGAPPAVIAALEEDLALILKTYNVEGQAENLPGIYKRYGFTFKYPAGWEADETGATKPTPDLDQGSFRAGLRPPGPAVVVLLTWNSTPASAYDPVRDLDQAITQAQQASRAYKTLSEGKTKADANEVSYFLYQDALEDGRPIFAGYGEWMCSDTSRVFTLFWATDDPELQDNLAETQKRFEGFTAGFSCSG